jgi:hypothetical protein
MSDDPVASMKFREFLDSQIKLMTTCYDQIIDNAIKHHEENCGATCRNCEQEFMIGFLTAFTNRMQEHPMDLKTKPELRNDEPQSTQMRLVR